MYVEAQTINIGNTTITGPLKSSVSTVGGIISIVLNNLLFPLAGVILLVMLIWGGFSFMTSSGEPDKVQKSKAVITTSIIGFVLLILSFFMVKAISFIFGLEGGLFF